MMTTKRKGKYEFAGLASIDRKEYNRLYYETKRDEIIKQNTEYARKKKINFDELDFKNSELTVEEILLILENYKHKLNVQQICDLVTKKNMIEKQ